MNESANPEPDDAAAVAVCGAAIRQIRRVKGLTQTALATGASVDLAQLRNIEAGRTELGSETLDAVAECLGVSPFAILSPGSLLERMALTETHYSVEDPSRLMHDRVVRVAELHHVLQKGGHPRPLPVHGPPAGSAQGTAEWVKPFLDALNVEALAGTAESMLGVDVMVGPFGAQAPAQMTVADTEFDLVLLNSDHPNRRALPALAVAVGRIIAARDPRRSPRDVDAFGEDFAAALFAAHRRAIAEPCDTASALMSLRLLAPAGTVDSSSMVDLSVEVFQATWAHPGSRPPSLLAQRCLAGMLDGTVSAAPVAGLLAIDSAHILAAAVGDLSLRPAASR